MGFAAKKNKMTMLRTTTSFEYQLGCLSLLRDEVVTGGCGAAGHRKYGSVTRYNSKWPAGVNESAET